MALNSGKLYMLAIAALCLLSLAACKRREDPVVHGNDPVFYTDITLPSGQLKQTAGQGDYYMYSDYYLDSGLLRLTAEIKSVKCADCVGYFTFSFSNTSVGSTFDDSMLQPGLQQFYGPQGIDTLYNVTFDASLSGGFVGGAPNYNWNFNDPSPNQNTPNPVITHQYQDSGIYHPTLTADNGVCSSSLTGRVRATAGADPCKSVINVDTLSSNEFKLKAITTGPGTFQYKWFFFGLSSADSITTTDSFYKVLPVDTAVKVRLITTSTGCTDSAYATINSSPTAKPAKSCYANFRTTVSISTQATGTPFHKVTIIYNDTTGKKYVSSLFNQPVTSSFTIQSVKEYDRNEKNQKTKQLVIEFNCRLYFTQTDFIDASGHGIIAVAYP